MKRVFLLLVFSLFGCAFLSANVPYFSEPDEPQKPYDAQSFKERFLNPKNDDLDTENMVRLGFVMPELGFYVPKRNHLNSFGLLGEYEDAYAKWGSELTQASPQITFMVRRTDRFSVGLGFYYATQKQNCYNKVTSEVLETNTTHIFSFTPTAELDIIRHQWFRLYILTGVEFILYKPQDYSLRDYFDAFCGFGYTVGKRFFFFTEYRMGIDSYCQAMGIGYRF